MAYGIQLIDGITQQNGGSFFLVRSKDVEYNGSGQSLDDAVKSGLFKGEKGDKGDSGEPFRITKTFETIGAMNAAFGTTDEGVTTGQFVVIATDNPDSDEDNGKLYVRTDKGYTYIVDLSGLKGIQGPKGDTGDAGAAGAKGDKGDKGDTGDAGAKGRSVYVSTVNIGSNSDVDKASITNADGIAVDDEIIDVNGEVYTVTAVAETTVHVSGVVITLKGPQGDPGAKGDTGEQGPKGDPGAKGDKGDAGESAFATWQAQEGNADKTEADFLASLKGDKGDKGDPGAQGPKGDKGDPGDAASVTPATTDEITALFTAAGA